ncbi:hypothetical protein ColLi_08519 [Colletotrichum liriopes]|uniref:Uncharacterized protein n=1 Tax=Colletotrichum liriopes TaxID=708192 RepID=A0AA37GR37_9PEZI|nr:hypothetical protein ColLi_08519 [Colletotrichum liriopes]
MPPKLFKNRYYFALITNALFASMTYSVLYVFWPTVVAKVFGGNSYYVAWQTSMVSTLFLIGMAIGGICIANVPRIRSQSLIAASVAVVFLGCLGSMKTDRYAQITASAGLLCFAIGFIENVALTGVTYIWEAQDIGLAFGVLGCICSLGCAFAQAGFVSILD